MQCLASGTIGNRVPSGVAGRMHDRKYQLRIQGTMESNEPKPLAQVVSETKYPVDAFHFVRHSLDYAMRVAHQNPYELPERERHMSARQLSEGILEFAILQFGPHARATLQGWNIYSSDDVGQIVYAMVDGGLMQVNEDDLASDFDSLFTLDTVFPNQSNSVKALSVHPIYSVMRVALYNAGSLMFFAACFAAFAIAVRSIGGAVFALVLAVFAFVEWRFRKALLFNSNAAQSLRDNQFNIFAVVIIYCILMSLHTLNNSPAVINGTYLDLLNSHNFFRRYGCLAVISLVWQGLLAAYYFRMHRILQQYSVPEGGIELKRN